MGIFLAILVSFLHAGQNTAVKKAATGKDDPMAIVWAIGAFTLVMLSPLYLGLNFFFGKTELSAMFWIALIVKLPLSILATWLYVLAHRHGEMSLINPLLSITPVVVLLIAPFTINQKAGLGGVVGVCMIAMGTYVLNFKSREAGYLEPIRMLFRNKGARYMLATATVYGITTIFDAVGVQNAGTNPLLAGVSWAFINVLIQTLVIAPFVIKEIGTFRKPSRLKRLALAGLFSGAMSACQMIAMTMLLAAYVNAIKRFSMVLSVLIGAIFFKEESFKERLVGSLIMLMGVITIVLTK